MGDRPVAPTVIIGRIRTMTLMKSLLIASVAALCAAALPGQRVARDLNEKIDALMVPAFQSAVAGFPCKIK